MLKYFIIGAALAVLAWSVADAWQLQDRAAVVEQYIVPAEENAGGAFAD